MATITINPINNGTNIITAADIVTGLRWSGSETGLDGQQIGVSIEKSYGNTRFGGTSFGVGADGTWSDQISANFPFDGVYVATAFATPQQGIEAAETFIVAQHATAFEVVGLAFNDVNQQLVTEPFSISINQELTAEQAGLQTLLNDAFPAKPLSKLIDDIKLELSALKFTPQSVGYADPKTIAKIEGIQGKMADLVHNTPALVAQQPDGIGWSSVS